MRRLRAQHIARGGHQLGRGRDLQHPRQGHPAQCRLVPPAVVPLRREQRGGCAGVSAQLLDATTNVSERLVNITQSAFAKLGDGYGLAEGGTGLGAGMAVLSGKDHRRNDARYVNRMMLSTNGGPASPTADGWVNYAIPVDCRPDVSRQRRDRRAETSVPSGVAGPRYRFRRRRPPARRAGAGGDLHGAGESGPGRHPVRRAVRAAARGQWRARRHAGLDASDQPQRRRDQAAEPRQHAHAEGPMHSRPRQQRRRLRRSAHARSARGCSSTCWKAGSRWRRRATSTGLCSPDASRTTRCPSTWRQPRRAGRRLASSAAGAPAK